MANKDTEKKDKNGVEDVGITSTKSSNNADLQKQVDELAQIVKRLTKNDFPNMKTYDKPVNFRFPNVFPKDETSIASGTSTGRIKIVDDHGNIRYIPYFS